MTETYYIYVYDDRIYVYNGIQFYYYLGADITYPRFIKFFSNNFFPAHSIIIGNILYIPALYMNKYEYTEFYKLKPYFETKILPISIQNLLIKKLENPIFKRVDTLEELFFDKNFNNDRSKSIST